MGRAWCLPLSRIPYRCWRLRKRHPLLTTYEQKIRLIAALGITVGLRVPFTEQFARQEPIEFVREVLWRRLGIHEVVVGHDFRFGHRRAGTVDFLQEQASILWLSGHRDSGHYAG